MVEYASGEARESRSKFDTLKIVSVVRYASVEARGTSLIQEFRIEVSQVDKLRIAHSIPWHSGRIA
jgi:hypothetical protein